ncbi:MAG TPA: ABC transporter substrate-binding protein [Pseudonocardia sp.]|jgi:ABC-type transport system substrate-binding protein|uniref:ABC transporter substrate-binding protein n=1 Tax=Pseudonocardia sp. TaxID=60912 RepID=UPI002B4AEFD8|nr:ABC transporter substrate-binding protein [Pseudonocardia sp.]HLU54494.1 ABC transporter substrate-binding protein [Pseudonocardia sp.]
MRTLKRRTFLLGSAAAVGLGTTACGGGGRSRSGPVGEPRPGGTLVLQMPSEISTHIHPLLQTDPAAMGVVSGTVYSKLLEFRTGPDVTTLEIEPDLAESWEVSPDGLTYTFRLRGDVRWHNVPPVNGRPFTSDDVVATFEAIKQTPAQYAWMYEPVSSVTAPDERTVVFTLDRPYTPLLEYLAYHFSMIVPREGLEGRYDLETQAIGTGPFLLESHNPDVEWVLRRNPDYHIPGRPYLDEIRLPILNDTAAVTAALRSGRMDVGTTSDVNVAEELRTRGFAIAEAPGAPISFYLNPTVEPFDDLRVRRAVVQAVDWVGMGENIRGRFVLTSLLRPDTSSAALTHDEVLALRPFDPDGARRLLAEAGLPNGFTTTMMVQRVDDEDVREAQWIQADLAEVGIDMEIEIVDPGTGIDRRRSHDFAIAKALRGVHLPDQVWRDFEPDSIENYALVDDPTLHELIDTSRAVLDEGERDEIYRQMQTRMETEICQALYPIQKFDYTIAGERVQDLWPSPIYQGKRLADVWLSDNEA